MHTHITTLTFYRFRGFLSAYLAFSTMGFSKFFTPRAKGMRVGKLLGNGAGLGFSHLPNWGKYSFLAIWDDEQLRVPYFTNSLLQRWLRFISTEQLHLVMEPIQSRGVWDGENPYPTLPAKTTEQVNPVAILTRAKLRFSKLPAFWRQVPKANNGLAAATDKLLTAGMGEWPFSHPITFSVWKTTEAAENFAYKMSQHSEAIRLARTENWFREDLFVRYKIIAVQGELDGKNPIEG